MKTKPKRPAWRCCSISIYLSIYHHIYLFYLSIYLYISINTTYLSIYLSIYMYICLSIYLYFFIYPSVYLSFSSSSIYLSLYLPDWLQGCRELPSPAESWRRWPGCSAKEPLHSSAGGRFIQWEEKQMKGFRRFFDPFLWGDKIHEWSRAQNIGNLIYEKSTSYKGYISLKA